MIQALMQHLKYVKAFHFFNIEVKMRVGSLPVALGDDFTNVKPMEWSATSSTPARFLD
jgi:hypothetical protein